MPLILCLETATKNCSVALTKNGEVVASREIATQEFSHAEKLHVFIEEVLLEAEIGYHDLNAIAISRGPGSYTGLRIGVSTAKGLCFALDIPLISVDTLKILASQAKVSDGLIIPMLDARRMEVYSAIFTPSLEKRRDIQAEVITSDSFSDIDETVYFVGDANEKCKGVLQRKNFNFRDEIVYPSALAMAGLSLEKFVNKEFEDVAYFEPLYLKDFLVVAPKK